MRWRRQCQSHGIPLRDKLQDGVLNSLPRLGARIDDIEVARAGNLKQVRIFFFLTGPLPFGGNVSAAEIRRNHIIGGAVNQPLAAPGIESSMGSASR